MKAIRLIMLLCYPLLLTGCWDYNEIEDIGFVMAVALDPVKEEEKKTGEEEEKEKSKAGESHQKFRTTLQISVPNNLGTTTSGGGGKSGNAFFTITSTGMTNLKNARNMSTRTSRSPNIEHLKVLIMNEELARKGMIEHLIDVFLRDHEMRRGTLLLISKGEAKQILETKLPLESMPDLSVEMISQHYGNTLSMIKAKELGLISERLLGKRSFLIPRIVTGGKGFKVAGAAIFMGVENKMIGWLGEEDVAGYNWVVGEAKNGVLEVPYQDKALFDFETLAMNSSIDYKRKNEQDIFHIKIKAEGTFGESWIHQIKLEDQKTIEKLNKAVAKEIEEQSTNIIKKMQEEFHADIFDLIQQVKQKDYAYWEKIRTKWDGEEGAFSKAKITVSAEVQIRHYMLIQNLD
jgi:spore germination protein